MLRLGLATAGFTFFALIATAGANKPSCDEAILPSCHALAKAPIDVSISKDLGFTTPRNGGTTFNAFSALNSVAKDDPFALADLHSPLLSKMDSLSDGRQAKSLAVAGDVRKQAIALILGTTNQSSLSPEQKVILQRLKTLNIQPALDSDKLCARDVVLGFPNAGYDDASHTLLLCPAAMNLSEFQLIQTVGHELGHVVNPCETMATLFQVDKSRATTENFRECNPSLVRDEEGDLPETEETLAIERMISSETPYAVGSPDNSMFQTLLGCGLIHAVPSDATLQKPTLFAATTSCLDRAYASDYKDQQFETICGLEKKHAISEAAATAMTESVSPRACFKEENEAFADAFSSRIVGEKSSSWNSNDLKTSFLTMLGFACFEKQSTVHAIDGYPAADRRLKSVMSDDGIAAKLDCSPMNSRDICPLKIDYSNPDDHSSRSNGKTKQSSSKTPAIH